jgi:SAM-dependent methyltransferase
VNALINSSMTVVDLGAGRGVWAETLPSYSRSLVTLKGKCRHLVGIDIDPAVLGNPTVDEALVIEPNASLPLADQSVDMIVAFAVLEHIMDPIGFVAEVRRTLRPGGWFCAWTPNKWGYVGIGARCIPNSLHAVLFPKIHPTSRRQEKDVFAVYYRMNTMGDIRTCFNNAEFRNCSYVTNGPPAYNFGSSIIARLILLYGRIAPPMLGQHLHIFLQRRQDNGGPIERAEHG